MASCPPQHPPPASHNNMGTVELVPTTEADLNFVIAAEQAPGTVEFIIPWERERHRAALTDPDIAHLTVWLEQRRVGFVLLAGLSSPHRNIEFRRIVVGEQGLGIGRRVIHAVQKLAFAELDAHRLWLDVKEHNRRARHLYGSEGFAEEGMLRECLLGPEGFQSLVVMSILAREYASRSADVPPPP